MMEIKKEKELVPALRFGEFEGSWEVKNLEDFLEFKNGINASKEQYGSGYKFINVLDIINNEFMTHDRIIGSVNVDEKTFKKSEVSYGDILFQRSSETREEVGQSNVYLDDKQTATFGGFVIRGKRISSYNPTYMNYLLKTSKVRKEITSRSGGSTRYNVGQEVLKRIPVYITSKDEEQKKIATFLSTVDQKIEQLRQKVSLLEQYKKGVLQQIFSQEIRFKEENGEDFADWESIKLKELTFKTGKKNKANTPYPVYSINNKEGFLPQSEQFEGMSSSDRGYDISLYKIIEKGTFAYNPARINVGSIGFSGDLNNIIISSLYVCFKTKKKLEDSYLLKYLETFAFNKAVLRNVEGGVRQYLFYDNFCNIKIPLPSNQEQLEIATLLSSIDQKITQTQEQLTQTQAFKKGLLQQLFV